MQRENIVTYVADRLKMMRKIKRLTLENVAQKMGVSRKQVQNYENCNCSIPLVRLYQLAEVLDINVSFFVEGIDKKPNSLSNDDLQVIYILKNIKDREVRNNIVAFIKSLQ